MLGLIPIIPKHRPDNPIASSQTPVHVDVSRREKRKSAAAKERRCQLEQRPTAPVGSLAGSPATRQQPILVIESLSKLTARELADIRQAGKFVYRLREPDLLLPQKDIVLQIRSTDEQGVMRLESIGTNHPAALDLAILQRKLNTSMVRNFIDTSRSIDAHYLDVQAGSLGSTDPEEKQKLAVRLAQCHAEVVRVFEAVNRPIRARIDQQLNTLQKRWRNIEDDPESTLGSVDLILQQISILKELTVGLNSARAKVAQHIKIRFLVARQAGSTVTIDVLIDSLIATLEAPAAEPDNLLLGGEHCAARLLAQRRVECFLIDRPADQVKSNMSRIDDLLTHALVAEHDRQSLISLLQDPQLSLVRLIDLVNTLEHNKAQAMLAPALHQQPTTSSQSVALPEAQSGEPEPEPVDSIAPQQQDIVLEQDDSVAEKLKQQLERIETMELRYHAKKSIATFLSSQIYSGPWFDRGANGKHENGKSYYTPVTYLYVRELGRLQKIVADPDHPWTRERINQYFNSANDCMKKIAAENGQYWRCFNFRYWTTFDTFKADSGKEMSLTQYLSKLKLQNLNTSLDSLREEMEENIKNIIAAKPVIKKVAEQSKNLKQQSDKFANTATRQTHFSWFEWFKFWKW